MRVLIGACAVFLDFKKLFDNLATAATFLPDGKALLQAVRLLTRASLDASAHPLPRRRQSPPPFEEKICAWRAGKRSG